MHKSYAHFNLSFFSYLVPFTLSPVQHDLAGLLVRLWALIRTHYADCAPSIRTPYAFTTPTLSSSSASQIAECSPKFRRHSAAIGQLRANPQLPPPTCRRERRSTPSLALVGSRPLGVVPADPVRSPLASRPYIPPELACVRASGNGSVLGLFIFLASGCTFCASAGQSKLFANM
jgi:hypothetical protein